MLTSTLKRMINRATAIRNSDRDVTRSLCYFLHMRHPRDRIKYRMKKTKKAVSFRLHRQVVAKQRQRDADVRQWKEASALLLASKFGQVSIRSVTINQDDPNRDHAIEQLLGDFFSPSEGGETVGFGMHFDFGDHVIDYDSTKPESPLNSMDTPIMKGPSGLKH